MKDPNEILDTIPDEETSGKISQEIIGNEIPCYDCDSDLGA